MSRSWISLGSWRIWSYEKALVEMRKARLLVGEARGSWKLRGRKVSVKFDRSARALTRGTGKVKVDGFSHRERLWCSRNIHIFAYI
jgi:hypothetical protein